MGENYPKRLPLSQLPLHGGESSIFRGWASTWTNTKQKSALALMGKESCVNLCLSLCSKFRPLPYTVCVTRYKWGVCLSLSVCHNPDYCCCFRVPTGADKAVMQPPLRSSHPSDDGDLTKPSDDSDLTKRSQMISHWPHWSNDQPLTTCVKRLSQFQLELPSVSFLS